MMKTTAFWATLILCFLYSTVHAQQPGYILPSKTQVIVTLDRALKDNLVKVFPHHHCYCNNCEHTYQGKLSITNMQHTMRIIPVMDGKEKKEQIIRVWGKAAALQRNQFLGNNADIFFIADLKEYPDELDVISLKWKLGDCMKYKLLLGGANEEIPQYTEEETEAEADPWGENVAEVDAASRRIANAEPVEEYHEEDLALDGDVFMEDPYAPKSANIPTQDADDWEETPETPSYDTHLQVFSQMRKLPLSKKDEKKGLTPEVVVEGSIQNKAKTIKYKDAILEITFFTKTKTELATERHTLYEFFEPEGKQEFSYSVKPPEPTFYHVVKLVEAVAVEETE